MDRVIDINRQNAKITLTTAEATVNDVVFWRNNDTQMPHWPTALGGGEPLVPFQLPARSDTNLPPTSDGFPVPKEDLQYGCKIEGHQDERGLIKVYQPLVVNNLTPNSATLNQPYTATPTTVGGKPPFTWSVISGGLPAGVSLSGNTISGTPTTAGRSTFVLQAADALGNFATKSATITVKQ
jgi:hypothetical protein